MARNVCAASWVGAAVPVFRRPRVSRRGGVGRERPPVDPADVERELAVGGFAAREGAPAGTSKCT